MCGKLIDKNYDIPTFEGIFRVAQNYGEPVEAFRALDEYKGLAGIYEAHQKARDYDRIKQELDEARTKIKQLEDKTADYAELKRSKEEIQLKSSDLDKRSVRMLENILVQIENPLEQRNYDKELVDSGLPELVERCVEDAVTRRLAEADNNALRLRFVEEIQKQIQENSRLWSSRDLGLRTPEKIKMLGQMDLANPFIELKGEWLINCNKCGDTHTLKLERVRDIRELLVRGHIKVEASPIYTALKGKHSVEASLEEVVKLYRRKRLREARIEEMT
jgi:hypothetical protein